jgi:hypothetical protein
MRQDSRRTPWLHRIANRSGAVAISLHVYGVGSDRIASGVNRIYA